MFNFQWSMCNDPDAVNLHNQVIPHAADLFRLHELHHALTQFWVHLQRHHGTALADTLTRYVAQMIRHAADAFCVLSAWWIKPCHLNTALRIAPSELFRKSSYLEPAHCRFSLRHSRFFLVNIRICVFQNGTKQKKAAELPSPAARIKNNLILHI